MDYIEAFKNLKTNNKYGRKSPHKAVLMLTIIELYEQNILTDNEIHYDDILKKTFLKVWNQVLPNEKKFQSEAYLPFWYLQSNRFWHIVPVWGEEDVLSLMRNENVKPSEAKLNKSVRYAELDEDLYFLMTVSSGRSSLKRTLLENYFTLTEEQVDLLSESTDNIVDNSEKVVRQYENMKSQDNYDKRLSHIEEGSRFDERFQKIEEDLQISFILAYYSFMKTHRAERHIIKKLFPSVYELYNHVAFHPILREDIAPSDMFTYENLLFDLKISLMSENGSMDLIDKIETAIEILRGNNEAGNNPETEEHIDVKDDLEEKEVEYAEGKWNDDSDLEVEHVYLDSSYNIVKTVTSSSLDESPEKVETTESRKGKPWTQEEEERITHYFERGISTADIAERIGRTEVAIKARLAKLGLIEYTYGQDESAVTSSNAVPVSPDEFQIENGFTKAYILNKEGEKVFSTDGKLKSIGGKIYRINLKNACFTIKDMVFNGEVWMKGTKKIVAYPQTELYRIMDDAYDYGAVVEDIVDAPSFEDCKLKVDGVWYNYLGNLVTDSSKRDDAFEELPKQKSNYLNVIKHPLYAVRKQAILRAMGYFRLPAKIRDIARTISRTAWGAPIKEDDVEEIIKTIKDVESVEDNSYILRKK